MERIPFGVISAMIQGGTGTYDGELRGEYSVTWLKREGDTVSKGEVIATVDVDKTQIEIPAPCDGRIVSLLQKTTWSADGTVIAMPHGIVLAPAFGEVEEIKQDANAAIKENQSVSVRATPLAKKIAEAKGVDVSRILKGTGAGGRICAEDVEKAKKEKPSREAPRAVPAARSYAEKHEIDLLYVKGTGPDGLIILSDVEGMLLERYREHLETSGGVPESAQAIESSHNTVAQKELGEQIRELMEEMNNLHGELWAQEHADETGTHDAPMTSAVRKTIARLLTRSWKEIALAGDTLTVDVTVLLEFISRHNTFAAPFSGVKLRLDYCIAWYARELLLKDEFRILNGYWDAEKEEVVVLPEINIGIAVDTERGLVVPVVHDVGRLSFSEFVVAANGAIERARRGALGLHEIRDLTFTVNNTGVLGGENPSPIIPYTIAADGTERPTAMILALARIRKEKRRSFLPVVFRFDHRLMDGREAVGFIRALRERIESKKSPEEFTAELSVVPRSHD